MNKGATPEHLHTPYILEVKDALMFQSAFCNKMFHEEEIIYGLEELLLEKL